MNMHKLAVILTLAGSLMAIRGAEYAPETITLVGQETYVIVVQDGKVIGGYAQDNYRWQILGGSYDGKNLSIIQKRDRATDSNKWITVHFKVEGDRVMAITTMNSEGEARKIQRKYRLTAQSVSSELAAARARLREPEPKVNELGQPLPNEYGVPADKIDVVEVDVFPDGTFRINGKDRAADALGARITELKRPSTKPAFLVGIREHPGAANRDVRAVLDAGVAAGVVNFSGGKGD